MIPVRVPADTRAHIVRGAIPISADHPHGDDLCLVCDEPLHLGLCALVYVGAAPADRARGGRYWTGAAVAVHDDCAAPAQPPQLPGDSYRKVVKVIPHAMTPATAGSHADLLALAAFAANDVRVEAPEEIGGAVLAAVLPVHRAQVLAEAAQSIIDHMDEHFPADGNDVQRRVRRHLRIAVQVVSPNPTQEQLAEKLVEMGVLRRVEDDPWQRRAAATGGGPCPGCGRPFWTHVCLVCSPDSQSPGPGCINCRQTGMDQTPCKPAAGGPTADPCREDR